MRFAKRAATPPAFPVIAPPGALAREGRSDKMSLLTNLCLLGGFLCCMAIGVVGVGTALGKLLSLALMGLACACWFSDDYYVFMALFLYFTDQFYIGGSPTYRYYSLLLLARAFLDIERLRFRVFILPAFLAVLCHAALVLWDRDGSLGFSASLDLVVVYLALCRLLDDNKLTNRFLCYMAFVAVASGVYGVTAGNVGEASLGRAGVYSEDIKRNFLSFTDPNYAGLFTNLAIIATLNAKSLKSPFVRLPLLGVLLYFLVLCNSMTAFACLALCLCLFVILRWPTRSTFLLLGLAALAVWGLWALMNLEAVDNIPALAGIRTRVNMLLVGRAAGDNSDLTSGRSELWAYYWDYFKNQRLVNKLFGGNVLTPTYKESFFKVGMAAHCSYLQALVQYGVCGAVLVFGTMWARLIYSALDYLMYRQRSPAADSKRAIVVMKAAMLFFAITIDMFPDWHMMLIFFM